ncbi:MAG TPA: LPS assembly lipoprotein LptE [Verrucomicrobiae bacterium]|nr:LPS assembly lipoprotein LptE [Verrucomicrobiae bacterium]
MKRVSALMLFVTLLASGCAGYRLGPTNSAVAGEKSIQLSPFSNQTFQPRLGDAVTTALRRTIQSDGTFKLATGGEADIIVTGTLIDYDRRELSLVPNDVLTVSDFRVNVKARVTARERASGKVLVDREVTGYTLVRVGSDLTSAERQALPVLADDLARNIASLLVDGDW